MNIILFGALSKLIELESIDWENVIATTVKPKFVDINIEAYHLGGKS